MYLLHHLFRSATYPLHHCCIYFMFSIRGFTKKFLRFLKSSRCTNIHAKMCKNVANFKCWSSILLLSNPHRWTGCSDSPKIKSALKTETTHTTKGVVHFTKKKKPSHARIDWPSLILVQSVEPVSSMQKYSLGAKQCFYKMPSQRTVARWSKALARRLRVSFELRFGGTDALNMDSGQALRPFVIL